jgi:hypothetical protein
VSRDSDDATEWLSSRQFERCIRTSIGTEEPIPKEMYHSKIAVRIPMMDKVKLLFASKPCKPLKPRPLDMILLVEENVRIKRRRTCACLNQEEINWQHEVRTRSCQKHGNKKERRIVAFVAQIRLRDEMIFGIMGVMEVDMIAK